MGSVSGAASWPSPADTGARCIKKGLMVAQGVDHGGECRSYREVDVVARCLVIRELVVGRAGERVARSVRGWRWSR